MRIIKTLSVCSLFTIAFLGLSLFAANAMGTQIIFGANYEFSGGTAPAGNDPWLTAMFDDHDTAGSVTLTMTATNLMGMESVKEWFFNLDPTMDPNDLSFSAPTVLSGSFDPPTIGKGTDAYRADGDGSYDLNVEFGIQDGLPSRFTAGDSVSFTITGLSNLTANSFNFLSSPGGGAGTFSMAAHVLNTPNGGGGSGWVASVPEPSTFVLCCMSLVGLMACVWRRHRG